MNSEMTALPTVSCSTRRSSTADPLTAPSRVLAVRENEVTHRPGDLVQRPPSPWPVYQDPMVRDLASDGERGHRRLTVTSFL